mmetsp:Transcript_29235/g.62166  ORF Transcript_29235/g.62166 Transcript_29235/m.62166 type:complete len:238 (-) Transcript_29235:996-1709(-)
MIEYNPTFVIQILNKMNQLLNDLIYSQRNRTRQTILIPWQLHSFQRLQIIKPYSTRIVLCKEWTANPSFVSALKETKDEYLLSHDFFHARNFYFSRSTTHAWATGRTDEARAVTDGITVNFMGFCHRNFKEVLGTCVTRHKHIIGNDTHVHFSAPLLCPNIRTVINTTHNRALRTNRRKCLLLQAADCFLDLVCAQLALMTQMCHNRHVTSTLFAYTTKQFNYFIGIVVGGESLRPK